MARLGLIALLLVCITITGVYATWTYAGTNDIADKMAEVGVTISNVELTGASGTYVITTNLAITVEQADNNHNAKLTFSEGAVLTITFTPSVDADNNIKENAVPSKLYFTSDMQYSVDANGNYDENGTLKDIFTFTYDSYENGKNIVWTPVEDGSFICTITGTDLTNIFSLNGTFTLDTLAEYEAFAEAIKNKSISAHISDGTINQ